MRSGHHDTELQQVRYSVQALSDGDVAICHFLHVLVRLFQFDSCRHSFSDLRQRPLHPIEPSLHPIHSAFQSIQTRLNPVESLWNLSVGWGRLTRDAWLGRLVEGRLDQLSVMSGVGHQIVQCLRQLPVELFPGHGSRLTFGHGTTMPSSSGGIKGGVYFATIQV